MKNMKKYTIKKITKQIIREFFSITKIEVKSMFKNILILKNCS